MTRHHSNSCVLMATLRVRLSTSPTNYIDIKTVLDSASGASLITERCAQALRCTRRRDQVNISGVGNCTTMSKGTTFLTVSSPSGFVVQENHPFLIVPEIAKPTPQMCIAASVRQALSGHILADPEFDVPSNIDAILGADLAPLILKGGSPKKLGPNLPFVVSSVFGSIVMGLSPVALSPLNSLAPSSTPCISSSITVLHANPCCDLVDIVKRFWQSEEPPPVNKMLTPDEEECEQFFQTTTYRNATGRYVVKLPFLKNSKGSLGNSYSSAYAHFLSLERRFQRDPKYKQLYIDFMRDYILQDHMQVAQGKCTYFIPHHGVFKAHGDTSKIRVVYNASNITTSGLSLNDLLYPGPKLQPLLSDIISLFRKYHYVFTCDVKQLFRQILIDPDDFQYQCILWREDPSLPLQKFYLKTVTWGTRSAPYLALRVLAQLAQDEGDDFPLAARCLKTNTFVDDIAVGASTIEEALKLKFELQTLLSRGGFVLSKWMANSPKLLQGLTSDELLNHNMLELESTQVTLLGLNWHPSNDTLALACGESAIHNSSKVPMTKRKVLSALAQMFDPCGWLTPYSMLIKQFLQSLWSLSLDWDTPISEALAKSWTTIESSANEVSQVTVRRPFPSSSDDKYILHGFSDASLCGYAAVVYLEAVGSNLKPELVMAKSRVAPLRTLTIPRLELCGAHLLAGLIAHLVQLFQPHFHIIETHLWTDSQIVLSWISTPSNQLKTYVSNRVSQIQTWTENFQWHHVPTCFNPADIASRGAPISSFKSSSLWWNGPEWLSQSSAWPVAIDKPSFTSTELEIKPNLVLIATPSDLLFPRVSSWFSAIRLVQYCLSWSYKVKGKPAPTFHDATKSLCRHIQSETFQEDIKLLTSGKPPTKRIIHLNPFLDNLGLLRVGGRLSNSEWVRSKHPIILPKSHYLITLLIDTYHVLYGHASLTFLFYHLSQQYWILSGRQAIKSRIAACVSCFRASPKPNSPLMGALPALRVTPAPPFHNSAMDFAGPFKIKASALRKSPLIKAYLCIFVCMATKAVHLELAADLSAAALIDVLLRFTARRGCPANLYSDCGTNFVGTNRCLQQELKTFFADPKVSHLIKGVCDPKGITFHFNPPAAPHQGGLWERAVKSVKTFLSRLLKSEVPTWQSLVSLLTKIESLLNSRPLVALSSDPESFNALTPGHFLIGRPMISPPELTTVAPSCNSKGLQWVQQATNHFWRRWCSEYLPQLHPRKKWTKDTPNLAVNDVVVVSEPCTPPGTWPLGRIKELFPGADGVVRVATVQTQSGCYKRPVVKLYKLPIAT